MSAIAGIINKDGRPADPVLIETLMASLDFRGPDGRGTWISANVALGFQAFWTTPEDTGLNRPLADPVSGLVIVMDGRVDNRSELLPLLSLPAGCSDPLGVLRGYQKWGLELPDHILGDFAIAIWDPHTQSLFCVRDRFGIRPFYFADTPECFVFASELRTVLDHPAVSSRLNEGMVAELLAYQISTATETLFSDVFRLAPRHWRLVTASRTVMGQYWSPAFTERRFATEAACADEFLDLLKTAVDCRLRRTGPAASFLSGGLDSTTITALACQLLPPEQIQTYSATYPGYTTDESFYIGLMADRYPVQSHIVPFALPPAGYFASWAARYRDFPGYPNGNALLHSLAMEQREHGVRVILGGQGGNHLLDGSSSVVADCLRTFRLVSFGQFARSYSYRGAPVWRTAYSLGIRPLLPKPQWLRRMVRRAQPEFRPLDADFVRRSGLAERCGGALPDWRPYGSMARRDMVHSLFSAVGAHFLELNSRDFADYGIEERSPFFDARLVEFAIQLPEKMRQRPGVWKQVLRQAAGPLLPPQVARRGIQAEFSKPSITVAENQDPPDFRHLESFLSADYLRTISNGGVHAILKTPGLGLLRGFAIVGAGYFLAAESARR